MSLSIVNHNGKSQFLGQTDLFPESLQLNIAWRQVSEKVQANFTIGLHFPISAFFFQSWIGLIVDLLCVMRMNAQNGIDRRVCLGNLKGPLPILFLRPNCEDIFNS